MHTNRNNELELQLDIMPFYLDFEKQYPLSQIVSCMIHASGEHANYCGFGIESLMKRGISWVLSRMTIDFVKPVIVSRPLSIITGVSSWSGLGTNRVIRLAQDGMPVADANSKWVAIDMKKRMPVNIESILTDPAIRSDYTGVTFPEMPKRLWNIEVQERLEPIYKHVVRYSDLDLNCHVNTAVWISLAMDAIPIEKIRHNRVKRAHLRFIKEGRAGDELVIHTFQTADAVCVQINCDEASYFQLLVEWNREC